MEEKEQKEKKWWHHQGPNFEEESLRHWRAWGSWFSWGSPVGMGLFLVQIGIFLWLLHLANIIH